MKLPELLSPAGGMEQLKAAVENGADAVYMGGKLFNARQNAANFDNDELRQAIEYAHVRGVNIYITMNTLVSGEEMQQAVDAAGQVYDAGADALIVQDLGFASVLRRYLPDLPLHISTQGTIYSAEGIKALEPLGFSRVILARELPLTEIRHIAQSAPLPVEVFAHGALCVCYSGQCLMSSLIGARSGNRGKCAQPCRLPYQLGQAKGYLLSPKDLCTLELLPELVASGVAALKIEGRMKSAEYVAIVTSIYRKYLDRCADSVEPAVDSADLHDLLQVFNRGGFTTGYLKGRQGKALISREKPKHWGIPIGTVVSQNKAAGTVDVRLTAKLSQGDGVEAAGDAQSGNIITYIAVGGKKTAAAEPGPATIGYISGAAAPNAVLYKTSDKALSDRARASFEGKPRRRAAVYGRFFASVGQPLRLKLWDGEGHNASVQSDLPAEQALTKPITEETALAQLMKTGDSPFELADCAMELDGQASAKLSDLNALRRQALEMLEQARLHRYPARRAGAYAVEQPGPKAQPVLAGLSLFLYRWHRGYADILHLADRVYLPFAALAQGELKLEQRPKELYAWLPPVSSGNLDSLVKKTSGELKSLGIDGVLIGNAEHLELLRDSGLPLVGDGSLNIFNGWTMETYASLGLKGITLSHELTMEQIAALPGCAVQKEAVVYGRLPMMTSAHCPVGAEVAGVTGGKPCGLCARGTAYELTDRVGARFPVLCDPMDCRSTLFNSDILAVPGIAARLAAAGIGLLRLSMLNEPPEEATRIIDLFRRALAGEQTDELKGRGYTKGHYFRGV